VSFSHLSRGLGLEVFFDHFAGDNDFALGAESAVQDGALGNFFLLLPEASEDDVFGRNGIEVDLVDVLVWAVAAHCYDFGHGWSPYARSPGVAVQGPCFCGLI
jgi:hypothetical protein